MNFLELSRISGFQWKEMKKKSHGKERKPANTSDHRLELAFFIYSRKTEDKLVIVLNVLKSDIFVRFIVIVFV